MKKEYLKPEMDVMEFMGEVLMQIASNEHEGGMSGEGGSGDTDEFNSNNRRGGWGNLWD